MKKVYINKYYNKALIINDGANTYTLTSATTAQSIRFNKANEGFIKWARLEYMKELLNILKKDGYIKA